MKKEYTRKELELINDGLNRIKSTRTHNEYLRALYFAIDGMGVLYSE